VVAAIRPEDVNFPLFLHVLGAMLLVGTLLAVSAAILLGWRRADPGEVRALTQFGLRTLLVGVFPSYVLMRIGAQWTEAAADLPEAVEDSAWLGIGYITADAGAVLILVSIVLSALGLRRMRAEGEGTRLARSVGVLATLLLAAYLVAVWAMAAKPE
jgi:hypothetical protein